MDKGREFSWWSHLLTTGISSEALGNVFCSSGWCWTLNPVNNRLCSHCQLQQASKMLNSFLPSLEKRSGGEYRWGETFWFYLLIISAWWGDEVGSHLDNCKWKFSGRQGSLQATPRWHWPWCIATGHARDGPNSSVFPAMEKETVRLLFWFSSLICHQPL